MAPFDRLCKPDFLGGSALSALLDDEHGGRFAITQHDILRIEWACLCDSNVLRTINSTKLPLAEKQEENHLAEPVCNAPSLSVARYG